MGLTSAQKRQAIYIKDIIKTPAWLAIQEIIKDYVYANTGSSIPPDVLFGMKLALQEVEGLVERYKNEVQEL